MLQPLTEYRRMFCEYQILMGQDSSRAEIEECENSLALLKAEKNKLDAQIARILQKMNAVELEEKKQQDMLHQMKTDMERMQNNQQALWQDECRRAGLSEKAAQLMEGENVRTSGEILQKLDAQLEKIEKIIAGYIKAEKKYMESITEIIDDPGR